MQKHWDTSMAGSCTTSSSAHSIGRLCLSTVTLLYVAEQSVLGEASIFDNATRLWDYFHFHSFEFCCHKHFRRARDNLTEQKIPICYIGLLSWTYLYRPAQGSYSQVCGHSHCDPLLYGLLSNSGKQITSHFLSMFMRSWRSKMCSQPRSTHRQ